MEASVSETNVSETASRGPETARREGIAATGEPGRSRDRGRRVAPGVAVAVGVAAVGVAAVGVAAAFHAGLSSRAAPSGAAGQGSLPPATAPVTRQDLSAATPVTATLGYAGSYAVTGQGGGTLTWLPAPGQVISQGHALYRTGNGSPVVLLRGRVPDWRALSVGVTGQDVSQLNHDLVGLGYADRADVAALGWDYYSWETAQAVQRLEARLGQASPAWSLSLGQVVFEPEALRVSQVTGRLGGPANGPVLAATSDRHMVTIPLDVSQESEVSAGDPVTVTLPDGTTTAGVVTSVGQVAVTTSGPGQSPVTTIPVQVRLADPRAAGTLDQAPVTVSITTATARNVLVVPVTALLAQASGGYEVELAGPGNSRRWVPVTTGIFDDADGLVQVTGALAPGERVVVPAT
jgi:hypothetical protein